MAGLYTQETADRIANYLKLEGKWRVVSCCKEVALETDYRHVLMPLVRSNNDIHEHLHDLTLHLASAIPVADIANGYVVKLQRVNLDGSTNKCPEEHIAIVTGELLAGTLEEHAEPIEKWLADVAGTTSTALEGLSINELSQQYGKLLIELKNRGITEAALKNELVKEANGFDEPPF